MRADASVCNRASARGIGFFDDGESVLCTRRNRRPRSLGDSDRWDIGRQADAPAPDDTDDSVARLFCSPGAPAQPAQMPARHTGAFGRPRPSASDRTRARIYFQKNLRADVGGNGGCRSCCRRFDSSSNHPLVEAQLRKPCARLRGRPPGFEQKTWACQTGDHRDLPASEA